MSDENTCECTFMEYNLYEHKICATKDMTNK